MGKGARDNVGAGRTCGFPFSLVVLHVSRKKKKKNNVD